MSTVYRARDLKARRGEPRFVALKVVPHQGLDPGDKDQVLAQFTREAAILASLSHPNLPRVLDYFLTRTAHALVMELVEGKSLERILEELRGAPMEEKKAIVYGIQVCRVLHYLSLHGPRPIVFRDLKPSNIMVTPSGRVKLVDFGIARFVKEAKSHDTFVFGTPGYAAPEQYGTGQTDQRSDIFSLGATLHHCLTGRPPPHSPLDFTPVADLNPRVSKKTAEVVSKALSARKDERYQDAQEMKGDLYDALMDFDRRGEDSFISRKTRVLALPDSRRSSQLNTIPIGPLSSLWGKTSPRLFEMPLTRLGCATLKGSIRFDRKWIGARPATFTEGTPSITLMVDPSRFEPGRVHTARATITTNAGVLTPDLRFRLTPSLLPWTALFFSLFFLFLLFI